jgi:hypothetical protein
VEARSKERRALANTLVRAGHLRPGGTIGPRGGRWYKPGNAAPSAKPRHVRFLADDLGASEAEDLTHLCSGNNYGPEDTGTLAFVHPNPRLAAEGWVYVEVASKEGPARKLYVSVPASHLENATR